MNAEQPFKAIPIEVLAEDMTMDAIHINDNGREVKTSLVVDHDSNKIIDGILKPDPHEQQQNQDEVIPPQPSNIGHAIISIPVQDLEIANEEEHKIAVSELQGNEVENNTLHDPIPQGNITVEDLDVGYPYHNIRI
jgi:hypothetical protein